MPGKRKQSAPRKADEQKRQCLAWNMQDMFINNSATTDTDQMVAGPSSSQEPSQVILEHRQTISQSDVLHDSMSSIDQSNGIHADQSLVSKPSQVIIEHGHISSQSNGFLESMSNIDQSNDQHTSQSLKSEVLDAGHKAKSVRFDEFSVVEIDIASSPPNVGSLEYGIDDTDVVSALNDTVLTNPADGHDFFLTMFDSVDDAKWHCSLGTIVLNLSSIDGSGKLPKVLPPTASPVLYVFEHTEKHVLHLESLPDLEEMEGHTSDDAELEGQEQDLHVYATTTIGVSILSGLAHMYKKKAARLVQGKYDPLEGTIDLHLYLLEEALSKPQFASEGLTGKGVSRKLNRTLQELMEWFLGIPIPESYSVIHKKRQDVEGLYRHVREAHQGEDRSLTLDPQHHLLVPSLRPYQKEAVLWMLEMEQFGEHLQQESRGRAAELHFLWREVQMPDGQILFFNSYTGSLCKEKQCGLVPIPGGILADEMGLGKTVEALALMLLHPRPGFIRTASATGCAEQDKNRTAVGMLQDGTKKTNTPGCTEQDNNRTAVGMLQDGNKTADADCILQDKDIIRTSVACTFQGENTTEATTASSSTLQDENRITCALLDKNSTSTDIKDLKVDCNELDSATVMCSSKSSNCFKPNVESSQMDIVAGKSNAQAEVNKCSTENSKDVFVCTNIKEEGVSAIEVTNQVSEEADSEKTAADFQQASTHNSSNSPSVLQPNSGNGKASACKMTDLTVPGSDGSESTSVSDDTSVHGSLEGKEKATEVLHAPTVSSIVPESTSVGDGSLVQGSVEEKEKTEEVSATVSAACVASMECPEDITCTIQDSIDSCITASTTSLAQEQPKEERQEIQDQQQSTSSTDARQPECQKKSSKKTASNSKSKGKKSKKGLAVVEPVYIPAPDSCNVQSTQRFECICGVTDAHVDSRTRLQCWQCGNWQHAECVNYNATSESDPAKMAEPYHCPHCSVSLPAVPSGATLIISPAPISHQWVDEINRHVRKAAIKMLVYSGVKKQGFLQPKVLADHDIVITTYDVLRLELNYVDIPHSNSTEGRRLRQQKRYMAVPSPLPSVEWWRVCLDEAQMVECTTAKAAEMALRLSAVNRWCVTGTPIQRNLEDLYGLLLFLGVDPYWVKHWWERLLYQPYCHGNPHPMYEVISRVMWRTAKKDVLDQINLPQQTDDVHWLKFSPVEEHFYRRKHEDCSRHAFKVLSQWHDLGTKLCQLDRRTMQTMLWPLLKLRQACCHPQAVRGEFLPLHKSTMTMDELLKSLTQKCKIECEEAHRQLICALNGLAGIHIIKEEYPEAVEKYREVLRSVQEHEGRLKTDKLQRLHTLHNLAGLLHRKHPGVAPTLRDDQLMKQAEELKTYYMQKSLDKIHSSQQTLLPIQQKVHQLRRKLQPGTPWWMDTLQWAIYWGKDEDLAERIRNELSGDRDPDATSIVNKFRDLRGLQFLLTSQLENLQQSHSAVCTAVNHLSQDPALQLIQSAVECHLRPEKGEELHTCEFCKADDLFLEYESRLFSFTAKRLEDMVAEEEENPERQVTRRGVWAQSETEKCLKIILSFCKSSRLEEQWVEEGNMQVELFEQLRREYKQLHVVWMALRDRVASIDELDMATTRLRLRLPEEERTDPPQSNIIEPGEVDHQWIKNLNDKAVATSLLHRKLGQLLYLKNLAKSQEYQKDGVNPEPCPICQRQLGTEWSVLMCGHCFCEECISVLVNQFGLGSRRGSIRCAICRQLTETRDISYVSTEAKQQEDVDVKGSHSTKVEAVVRTLKLIQQKDPTAKSLVFSTWQDVLDVVATALRENNMEYRAINGIHRFQENLTDFKYDSRIGVLLLPLHTGSHGLNIIEATHVLLVEPIINPAQEAQAIGRVHRIGQTKATVVHRFLVQNTIEERIHAMKKHISASDSIDTQSEGTVLTVGDLRDLFSDAFHHREDDSPPPPQQEYDQNNGVLEEFDDGDHHPADGPHTP